MGTSERRARERAEREARIVGAARSIAEREGWDAVTIRRLADEIEYSQPVLYAHFASRDAILATVALEGFREIAEALSDAASRGKDARGALRRVAEAYVDFAQAHPALYDAMFNLPTSLQFAKAGNPSELGRAFQALAKVLEPFCPDIEDATETWWAALHGLAALERSGRIRPGLREKRIALLVRAIISAAPPGGKETSARPKLQRR